MTAIHPFRALRYHPEAVGDLTRVIAPPYDVINPQEQEQLYQASPHNIVRLILGKQFPEDSPQSDRYTRAQADFQSWRREGILRRDAAPGLYLIEQVFGEGAHRASRLGVIALLSLDEATTRGVLRHEATLSAPKADRTKLLDAVPANLSPIFCVYPDERGRVQALLRGAADRLPPTASALYHGEPMRLWHVADPALIGPVVEHLASTGVLIADGHHRFEVACSRRDRYGFVMSYFVSMADPGLVVRPIHRVLGLGGPGLSNGLRDLCDLEPAPSADPLLAWLAKAEGSGRFGCFDGRNFYKVSVKPDRMARWLMSPAVPLPLATLDVSLLHELILPGVNVDGAGIRYTADAQEAVETVRQGSAAMTWLLRGIELKQVFALAAQGYTLKPKSTYFYPKVPSGLTLNPFD